MTSRSALCTLQYHRLMPSWFQSWRQELARFVRETDNLIFDFRTWRGVFVNVAVSVGIFTAIFVVVHVLLHDLGTDGGAFV
jgi:hypothetical protein